MTLQISHIPDVHHLGEILLNDGTIILPTPLGYAIMAVTQQGANEMYNLKNRPIDKPSGVLGTLEIFSAITISEHAEKLAQVHHPLGVIETVNEVAPAILNLPDQGLNGQEIAVFLNLDPILTSLAHALFEEGHLIVVTSANKAGTGNCYQLRDIDREILEGVSLNIDGGKSSFVNSRGEFEKITTTMINRITGEYLRPGAFENILLEQTAELGLIDRHEIERHQRKKGMASFRSALFIPTFKASSFTKLSVLERPDWVVLDLEDGCPAGLRNDARQLIELNLKTNLFADKFVAIRINELHNEEEVAKDLSMRLNEKVNAFILPMLETVSDLLEFERRIVSLELSLGLKSGSFRLIPLIETAAGLINAASIAAASKRNIALILGHADLFGSTHSERTQTNLHDARFQILLAARAAGIKVFDTPFEDVKNPEGLIRDCESARRLGFDGKIALHFSQLEHINKTFGINIRTKREKQGHVDNFRGGCYYESGMFIGAPIIQQFKQDLTRTVYVSPSARNKGVQGKKLSYGVNYALAFPGQVITSPLELTLDESLITAWHSIVPGLNPLETSVTFAKKMGLAGRQMPYHRLINLGLCMLVECYSESCIFHLGVSDAHHLAPVYSGDTVNVCMQIKDIRNSSSGDYSVFDTVVIMTNQHGERVLWMNRRSLFPRISKIAESATPENVDDRFDEPTEFVHRPQLLATAALQHFAPPRLRVNEGSVVLHGLIRPMGISAGFSASILFKNTHPLHINTARYDEERLAVSGGFVLPMVIGSAQRDIKGGLQELVLSTAHINPVRPQDSVGAFSYVLKDELDLGQRKLTLRTFGVKNIDVEKELDGVNLPYELLEGEGLKPQEIESICGDLCPELSFNICMVVDWIVWVQT